MISAGLFSVDSDGIPKATGPFIAKCGCSGAESAIRNTFLAAGINPSTIMSVKDGSNATAKAYLMQEGYKELVPALKKSVHAVLIHPEKKAALDLMEKGRTKEQIGLDIKELLS